MVVERQIIEWRENPVTEAWFQALEARRDELDQARYVGETMEETFRVNCKLEGGVQELNAIVEATNEDLVEDLSDE